MAVTITELEMSLDAANKNNAVLQNTTKVQQQKIQVRNAAIAPLVSGSYNTYVTCRS